MTTMTSSAGVFSNWLIAHHDLSVGFWHKSIYMYAFGALLNLAGGYLQTDEHFSIGQCIYEWVYVYDFSLWVVVLTNVLGGLLVGMLLRQLGVLSQNVAACSIMFATAGLQWVIMFMPPSMETLLGAAICAVAVSLYNDDVWALIKEQLGLARNKLDQLSPPLSPTGLKPSESV